MLHVSQLAATLAAGIGGASAMATGAVLAVTDQSTAADLGPYITGGGALTTSAVLGIVAVKLARGELVAREPARVEAQLARLVEDAHELVRDMAAQRSEDITERAADRVRTNALIERAIETFAATNNRSTT